MRILFVAAEVAPFTKTGGLGDVAGALPKALARLGHDVRVVTPLHGSIDRAGLNLRPAGTSFAVPLGGWTEPVALLEGRLDERTPVYFVQSGHYFDRPQLYGYGDDGARYVLFARAALEAVRALDWTPDVVHAHDWHTGLIPNWLKTLYRDDPRFAHAGCLFTVHNAQYQGHFDRSILPLAGLDPNYLIGAPLAEDLHGHVIFLARGVRFADLVNTVSPTYARELLTPEYGERLEALFAEKGDRLVGVLNGIDTDEFNPETDAHLASCYNATSLDGRPPNKPALLAETGLDPDPRAPLIGMVTRLADQKGFDILAPVVRPIVESLGARMILLGTGDPRYHDLFSQIARDLAGRFSLRLSFDPNLARRVYAGSDLFLMPSRFEPCGLGQMLAMRYGSVPVVRHTGGLVDTVFDYDPATGVGNGFAFRRYDPYDLFAAVVRALEHFRDTHVWRTLQTRGMQADHSWARSAHRYAELYARAQAIKTGIGT